PETLPHRRTEDRSQLRRKSAGADGGCGDRPLGHRAGGGVESSRRSGGRGNEAPTRFPQETRLSRGAGLLLRLPSSGERVSATAAAQREPARTLVAPAF